MKYQDKQVRFFEVDLLIYVALVNKYSMSFYV